MSENDYPARNLSPAQRLALDAMASGATKSQAGAIANRSVRTIDRWLQESSDFQAAIKAATGAAVEDAERRLAGLLEDSISAMQRVLMSPDSPPHVVLRAGDLITSNHKRMREFNELEARIEALEEQVSNGRY